MTDTDISALTPEQATAELARLTAEFKGLGPPATATTPAEAQARMDALTQNQEWRDKLFAGDVATRSEFDTLTKLQADAADRVANVMAGKTEPPVMEMTTPEHPLSTHDLASSVETLREAGIGDEAIRQALNGDPVSAEERRQVEHFKTARFGDEEWRRALLSGDHEARRELALMSIVLGAEVTK
jgi:hypothetical protein